MPEKCFRGVLEVPALSVCALVALTPRLQWSRPPACLVARVLKRYLLRNALVSVEVPQRCIRGVLEVP